MRSSWKQLRTFLTSVLMAGRAVHVIPHVPITRPEGMDAVLPPKVVWLFRSPVAKFVWTTIHPGEQSFCGNVIQTDPRSVAIMSVLDIYVLFLPFNSH